MFFTEAIVLAGFMFGDPSVFPPAPPLQSQSPQTVLQPGIVHPPRTVEAKQSFSRTFENISIREILFAVASHAGYSVVYDDRDDSLRTIFSRKISIRFSNSSVLDAITKVLAGTGYQASLAPNGIGVLIGREKQNQQTQESEISGQVVDSATGRALAGVTVAIAGTNSKTTTDAKGQFRLMGTSQGQIRLEFKLIGYRTTTRTITMGSPSAKGLHVTLVPTATILSGVVTTATGVQNRRELGNAITSINVDSVMRVAPVRSLTDLLETRVPGMTIRRSSGQPGDPSRIRIRGASSISGSNDPVVYVDGIRRFADSRLNQSAAGADAITGKTSGSYSAPSALDQIDPNDIETIDIFKGPSAAAMYGSDAANGVIVITTKKGRAGPPLWSIAMDAGFSYSPGKYPEGYFAYASVFGLGDLIVSDGDAYTMLLQQGTDIDSLIAYQALNKREYSPFGRGITRGLSTTVSGGSQILQYRFTGSYSGETGLLRLPAIMRQRYREFYRKDPEPWMIRPDLYSMFSGSANMTANISPTLRIALNTSLTNSDQRHSALGNTIVSTLMSLPPDSMPGPSETKYYERNTNGTMNASHTVSVDWRVAPQFPLSIVAGINTMHRNAESMRPRGILNPRTVISSPDSLGFYSLGNTVTSTQTINMSARRVPVGIRALTATAGLSVEREQLRRLTGQAPSLPTGVTVPNVGILASQTTTARTILGWYVQPQFDIKSRFFVIPGFRLDNTSLSGKNAKFMRLPKMQVSWLVSDEPLFPWSHVVDELRLRTSFGVAGTQPQLGDRLRLLRYDTTVTLPPLYQYGGNFTTLGNTHLRPEASEEFEGGFDVAVWHSRLSMEVTGYVKTRRDAIVTVPLPLSLMIGSTPPTVARNIGTIRNMGHEISISAQVIESKEVSWINQLQWSRNSNRVISLNAGEEPVIVSDENAATGQIRILAGYPLNSRWARTLVGYADANNDGVIASNEIVLSDSSVYIGQPDPTTTATFNSNLTLMDGRLHLAATFGYEGGGLQTNQTMNGLYSPLALTALKPGASLEEQATARAASAGGYLEQISVLRFHSFSVGYQIPEAITRRMRVRRSSLTLQGQNLWIKTQYTGKDPNVNSDYLGNNTIDRGQIPQPRVWSLRFTMDI